MCFSKHSTDPPLFDNLNRPHSFSDSNWNLWNDNCDYVQVDELKDINQTANNMTVLQLNICGAVSKKSDLINLLDNCKKQNMEIDIILLCETFLSDRKNHYLQFQTIT